MDLAVGLFEGVDEDHVGVGGDNFTGILAGDFAKGTIILDALADGGAVSHDVIALGFTLDGGKVDDLSGAVGDVGDGVESDGCTFFVESGYLVGYDIAVRSDDALGDGGEGDDHVRRGELVRLAVDHVLEVGEIDDRSVVLEAGDRVGDAGGEGAVLAARVLAQQEKNQDGGPAGDKL